MRRFEHMAILLLFICACARQGVIPNPDRFPPYLLSATSVNRTQISLRFNEELDPALLWPSAFLLNSTHDTAGIRFISVDPSDSKILLLFTSPLIDEVYRIKGLVTDRNGNASNIDASFRASTRSDTLAPYITLSPLDTNTAFPYRIRIESSEPVDTSSGIRMLYAPFTLSDSPLWEANLSRLLLECRDTTLKNQVFYLALLPGVHDFAGNRTSYGLATFVYSDTALELRWIRGVLRSEEGQPAAFSCVLFKRSNHVFGLTIADSSGSFATKLAIKDSIDLEAWFDREGDGLFEERAKLALPLLSDSIKITTQSTSAPRRFDQLIPGEE